MKKIVLLILLNSFLLSDIFNVPSDAYPTIQSGIDVAQDGDTVLVAQGIYYENLIINRSITLASHAINDILDDVIIDNYDTGRRRTKIVVTGDTYDFHDAFKEFGGRFVRDLEDRKGSGWIFKIKKRGGLISLLQKEKKKVKETVEEKTGCNECNGKQDDYGAYFICKSRHSRL